MAQAMGGMLQVELTSTTLHSHSTSESQPWVVVQCSTFKLRAELSSKFEYQSHGA
jgi:hypothetical protein